MAGGFPYVMRTRRTKSSSNPVLSDEHRSVLLHEAIEALGIKPESVVVDATIGGAGHSKEIVSKLDRGGVFIGIDRDADSIQRARVVLKGAKAKVYLFENNFRNVENILDTEKIDKIDACIFDLGWSSYHLKSGRGFSFKEDEPLIMTYAKNIDENAITAKKIVNEWAKESIADILWGWGEERFSRRIAKSIVEAREKEEITSTYQLVDIISSSVPKWYRHKKIHPATKTFQALRIAVNDEMGAIEEALNSLVKRISPNGKMAVITFHSVEDRLVKGMFRKWKEEGIGNVWKLIKPTKEEVKQNPRSRSAKLRVFEKI